MYDGNAKGIYLDNLPGADITFDSEDFFVDIMKKHVMTIFNENGEVLAISLADTNSGLDAVLECQEEGAIHPANSTEKSLPYLCHVQ